MAPCSESRPSTTATFDPSAQRRRELRQRHQPQAMALHSTTDPLKTTLAWQAMCSRATATMHCYLYEESHFWHYFGPLDTIGTSRPLIYPEPRYPPHPQASALSTTCLGTSPPWRFLSSMCRWRCVFPTCMSVSLRPPAVELPEALLGPPFPVAHGFLVAFGPRRAQRSCRFPKPDHDTQSLPMAGAS